MAINGGGKINKGGKLTGPGGSKQKSVGKQVNSIKRKASYVVDKIKEDWHKPISNDYFPDMYPKGSLTDKYKKKSTKSSSQKSTSSTKKTTVQKNSKNKKSGNTTKYGLMG